MHPTREVRARLQHRARTHADQRLSALADACAGSARRDPRVLELVAALRPVAGGRGQVHLRAYQCEGPNMPKPGHIPADPHDVPEPINFGRECGDCAGRGWSFAFTTAFWGDELDEFDACVTAKRCRMCAGNGHLPWWLP